MQVFFAFGLPFWLQNIASPIYVVKLFRVEEAGKAFDGMVRICECEREESAKGRVCV